MVFEICNNHLFTTCSSVQNFNIRKKNLHTCSVTQKGVIYNGINVASSKTTLTSNKIVKQNSKKK